MAHFFLSSTRVCNKHIALEPIKIHTPSDTVLQSMHEADLDLPGLPLAACHGHIVLQLASRPLLSIGQLCDVGCSIAFTVDHITIHHNSNLILQGQQTPTTKLWQLDIQPTTPESTHMADAAIGSATPTDMVADMVAFARTALFSPTLSTLAEALCCGLLPEFSSLTLQWLQQHPPQSLAMLQGHMDQEQQNKNSTKPKPTSASDKCSDDDSFPEATKDGAWIHYCYAAMLKPTRQIYTDHMGKFVAPSSMGNSYILILYDYDRSTILAIPFKNH